MEAIQVCRHDGVQVNMYHLQPLYEDTTKTCIRLWDTPGFTYGEGAATYQHNQLSHMLEGCIPDGFKGLDRINITLATPGFRSSPTVEDKMHVVFLMVHYKHLTERCSPYMDRICEFISYITNDSSPFTKSKRASVVVSVAVGCGVGARSNTTVHTNDVCAEEIQRRQEEGYIYLAGCELHSTPILPGTMSFQASSQSCW